mmetsp:Transcript_71944/g.168428  ORF Transcript_71944/g.168428 Transcript_71944/m.168428 type:complete len:262 (+) Transcript_71944:47-832(+)
MAGKEAEAVAAIAEKNAQKAAPISTEEVEQLDPEHGFKAARAAAAKIHELLDKLKKAKQATAEEDGFDACSVDLQKQLLSLRRAHRAMIKFSETRRLAEVAARKLTETEYTNMQTRKYESAVCRMAAGRCRYFPTPDLDKLRPLIDGFQAKEEDEKVPEAELTALIDAELKERISLEERLKVLEAEKQTEQKKLKERIALGAELTTRMGALKRAMEPVRTLLQGDDGKRKAGGDPQTPAEGEQKVEGNPAKKLKESDPKEA